MKRLTKSIFAAVAVIFSLLLTYCGRGEESVEAQADEFLKAYLSIDYDKAAALCTDELSQFLNETGREFTILSDSVKAQIVRQTAKVSATVDSIEKRSKDTVIVNYSLTDDVDVISKTLSMVKVDGEWKVAALNRL